HIAELRPRLAEGAAGHTLHGAPPRVFGAGCVCVQAPTRDAARTGRPAPGVPDALARDPGATRSRRAVARGDPSLGSAMAHLARRSSRRVRPAHRPPTPR